MNTGSSINLKLNSNLSLLFNQFNDLHQTQSIKIQKTWPIVDIMILMT